MLTSRERVLTALDHVEPDRVPVFFGTSGVTSMLAPAYERLKERLGLDRPSGTISRVFQYARIDEEVMVRFGSDGRPLLPGPAPSPHRRDMGPDAFVDEWGVEWRRAPEAIYHEVAHNPLRAASLDELERFPLPDMADPARFVGLATEARRIREAGYAVVALPGVDPFEQALLMRGMDALLMDMAADREVAHVLIGRVARVMQAGLEALLEAAGEWIDVVTVADDLGGQERPLISRAMYREFLAQHHARVTGAIHARSRARVMLHTDGNVYPLIPDLIDVGVDVLNPVQVSAREMGDTARLKREFGDRLCFNGAIDSGWVLPHGSTDDVRREVRRRIADLAPGGGYVLSSVHCIQPDVPTENVLAMFDEARIAGRYPIRC